jgi:ATP-binding cassette subfamily C protein CydCD
MKLNLRLLKEARYAQIVLILSTCFGLIGGILSIFQARELSKVISQVFLEGKTLETVSELLIAILVIIFLRASLVWAGEISAGAAARQVKQGLRQLLFTHIQQLGPAYLRSEQTEAGNRTGELVNLATEGIDALDVYISQYLPQIAMAALIPLAILVFVFPSDYLSGIVLLVTAPLMPIFMILIGGAAEVLTRKQWLGLSRMSAYFLDILQGLTTLKSLGRSRDQTEIIRNVSEHYRHSTMNVLKVTFLSALVLELIATLSTAVVAVEIGIRLLYGKMAFEQAFFILLLAPEFYAPLRLLGTRFHGGMAGAESARRIFEVLDLPIASTPQNASKLELPQTTGISPPSIELNKVGYAYSNSSPVLQDVSFVIPSGKMTALIGESGAGKTTLTWLLLRFLHPQNGEILVDGKLLNEIPAAQWCEYLAWVPQNPYLFNGTIATNINLANRNADWKTIQQAARLAHADEFIMEFPQGYDTVIGERGIRLSAGQAQRIALARAFLKDAPFLILDEATSHLDPEMDSLILESLERLASGRTVLVIAHHLNTLTRADQVIKLSHGKVDQSTEPISSTMSGQVNQRNHVPALIPQNHIKTAPIPIVPTNEENQPIHKQSVVRRLLNLLSPFWSQILLSIFLGFAAIASGVGLMATAAYIISAAALHPSIAELQVAIVGVRFFGLSRGVFRYLERLVSHDVTFRLLARWRVWFYEALEPLAPSRLMHYHSGDLLSRVIRDIGSLESFYVRTVSPPLVALLVSVASILFLGIYGTGLAWGLLGALVLAGIALPLSVLILSRHLGPKIIQLRANLGVLLIDAIQGMPDLLIFDRDNEHTKQVHRAGEQLVWLQFRMAGVTALQTALGSMVANLGMMAVLILAIQRVSQGQLDGVFLGVVTLAALTCFEAMQPLPQVAQNFDANRAAARRLYDLVDSPATVVDPTEPLQLPLDSNLEMQNLSFQYPARNDDDLLSNGLLFKLRDITFSLPQGKHIALIGPSGAGKTTLISLLLRFWDYHQGTIRLGDHELHQYLQDDIRKRISIIAQNTYLFSATIKENLLIAQPQATDEEIIQAAKQAQLYDFIQSLPAKYDTWVGEHGLRLSAGERQRLAIARALLKDSPLLILDEPTANLDPITELALLNAIQELSQGRSTITITQRMVGLETMDEILVLQNGRIIEHGNHEQLVSTHGLYSRMWNIYHQIM